MPNVDSKHLTKKQIYWLKHLREAKASGRPFAAYARSQGLRPAQLYTWSSRLRALGVWASSAVDPKKRATRSPGQNAERSRPTQPSFVAARVVADLTSPFTNGIRIRFPNGIMLEVGSLVQVMPDDRLLSRLAALP